MVYLQTILIGVVIVGLGALLLYIFKIRQLYIVVPTLYGYSDLTSKGKVFEVKLYNKSLQMEEDIQVTMPSDFSYSIIATDNNAVKLESNRFLSCCWQKVATIKHYYHTMLAQKQQPVNL